MIFFFLCYGPHRDLHSFPTRRSSDLGGGSQSCPACTSDPAPRSELPWPGRSEEHTSELQSPDQLVCRLLLEKKNGRRGEPDREAHADVIENGVDHPSEERHALRHPDQ